MKSSSRGGWMQLGSSIVGDRSCDFCGVSFLLCVHTFFTLLAPLGCYLGENNWDGSATFTMVDQCRTNPSKNVCCHCFDDRTESHQHVKHQDGSSQITNSHACQGLAWDWCALGRYVNWIHATKLRKRIKFKHAMMSHESNSNSNKSVWIVPKKSRILSKKYIMPWNIENARNFGYPFTANIGTGVVFNHNHLYGVGFRNIVVLQDFCGRVRVIYEIYCEPMNISGM